MEYNTQRQHLVLKEYGRNIQNMIDYCCSLEDDKERNDFAKGLIELMGHLNPHLRNIEDFRHKLWHHLIIMSDFRLKVDSPYDIPTREELAARPDHIGYPDPNVKYKHYGKNVETMLDNAIKMQNEPEKQKEYLEVIGSYMKLVSQNFNKESVNDDLIKNDLKALAKGKVELDSNANIDTLTRSNRKSNISSTAKDNNRRGGDRRSGGRSNDRRTNSNRPHKPFRKGGGSQRNG